MIKVPEISYAILLAMALSHYCVAGGKHLKRSSESMNIQEYFDLSYSFSKDTIFFPGQKEFVLNRDYDGVNKSGTGWYSAFSFCMAEHGGTHVDAPYHFYKDGWTIDKIPPSHLIDVPAVVINVEELINSESTPSSFSLEVSHLVQHEVLEGSIPTGAVVLIYTGWAKYWPDKIRYLGWENGTDANPTTPSLNFPGMSEDSAKWLTDERQIVGIGIDTPSVDPGSSKTYPAHIHLAEKQIYNIENVANLHSVIRHIKSQKSRFPRCNLHLFVMPLKIIGATGAPSRVLAYCK